MKQLIIRGYYRTNIVAITNYSKLQNGKWYGGFNMIWEGDPPHSLVNRSLSYLHVVYRRGLLSNSELPYYLLEIYQGDRWEISSTRYYISEGRDRCYLLTTQYSCTCEQAVSADVCSYRAICEESSRLWRDREPLSDAERTRASGLPP